MDQRPSSGEFGKRRPAPSAAPVKRSRHVALLLMGTLAVGGGAYALMPRERCQPSPPGAVAPALPEAECGPSGSRGSSGSSGGGGRGGSSSFSSSGDSSGRSASAGASESGSGGVTRGGFGSFGHGFGGSGGE